MIFDTDILIWLQRGNSKAADAVQKEQERYISVYTYMELLQCAQNRKQHSVIKSFIREFDFMTLPLNERISHRASIYIEEYALSSGLRAGDALIAACAVENSLPLLSGNTKHFKIIKELNLKAFRP